MSGELITGKAAERLALMAIDKAKVEHPDWWALTYQRAHSGYYMYTVLGVAEAIREKYGIDYDLEASEAIFMLVFKDFGHDWKVVKPTIRRLGLKPPNITPLDLDPFTIIPALHHRG